MKKRKLSYHTATKENARIQAQIQALSEFKSYPEIASRIKELREEQKPYLDFIRGWLRRS